MLRARIGDRHAEEVATTKGMRRIGLFGPWFGIAPDDSPLVMRDVGTHEIYGLDWEAP